VVVVVVVVVGGREVDSVDRKERKEEGRLVSCGLLLWS
jgi:hypothetical protein